MNAGEWFDAHEQELIDDTCALVRIPSVSIKTGDPNVPYGQPCVDVLNMFLGMGEKLGFQPFNHENYCGTLLWKGESDTEIGICGHLDVVPVGAGWTYEPFAGIVEDGKIIGRGAADNKIAVVTALYVMRYLKEMGYKPKHSLRLFVGCSEETGMEDLEYYASHYKEPAFSIITDAPFPVINGEKGLLEIDAAVRKESNVLTYFKSGSMSNAVPAHAEAILKISPDQAKVVAATGAAVEEGKEPGTWHVSTEGKPAHAAFPEGSESAQVKLANMLLQSGVLDEGAKLLMESVVSFFSDYYGAGLGIPFSDEYSGKLTHVGGMCEYKDGIFWQNINIRYNIKADRETLVANIRETMGKYGYELTNIAGSDPCFTDPASPIVKDLTAICNKVLELDLKPYVMGGGTYARKLKHAVAFGPGIPNRAKHFGPNRDGAHQADEYAEVALYRKAFLIYVESVMRLDELVEL